MFFNGILNNFIRNEIKGLSSQQFEHNLGILLQSTKMGRKKGWTPTHCTQKVKKWELHSNPKNIYPLKQSVSMVFQTIIVKIKKWLILTIQAYLIYYTKKQNGKE